MKDREEEKRDEETFIWKPGIMIKSDENCTITLTEKDFSKTVIIENGKITKKPDDIDVLGVNTPFGFEIRGLKRRSEKKTRVEK